MGFADQAIFVRFLLEVCWLLSFFSPEVPIQGELVRATEAFSWATYDETKVAALPRSRGQDDGRGWRRPEGGVGKSAMRGQFLFCCSLQPSFQQSFERDGCLKVLNSHVTLKLKCSGPTGRAVGHWNFNANGRISLMVKL